MPESTEREENIFAGALAVPEGEQPRFLDEACGGDAELRRRVEALLKAHGAAGTFMEAPAGPHLSDPVPPGAAEAMGTRIGRYKLLQKIGEGGCGVVWMALQEEPVRRYVALKIIKLGMDTREVIARFDAERQALAMMDHPSIAKILDAGATETGRPYFAMELVRGMRITDFSDRYNLSTSQRLELFSQVCHAVQHAHQKGIIHRDLKPSNILVTFNDGVPTPKVIDFGIAKATAGRLTDHTLFTALEQFIGTPAYMSPEQAELSGIDVDTRSDIYSLGVLLYELLTGRPPFDPKSLLHAGLDEIRRIIREVEPPKPSANLSTLGVADRNQVAKLRGTDPVRLSLLLRGDLDWIVMRCLEKNRTRRYETPSALAADISCHLRDEPVAARPPSRVYRFERLVRRNRLAFAAITAVALALIGGFAVSTWQMVRATRAERLANLERAQAEGERLRAEDLLNFMLGDLYKQLDNLGRIDVLESVAAKATSYFASLSSGDLTDITQLSRAKALRLLAAVRMSQARYADAEAALLDAYGRAAGLTGRHPKDGDMLFERGQAEYGIGYIHLKRADYAAADIWYTRYRDTGAALVALDPKRTDWQLELIDGRYNLAELKLDRSELEAARADFLDALSALQRLITVNPAIFDLRDREQDAYGWLGIIAELEGNFSEALEDCSARLSFLRSLVRVHPKDVNLRQYETDALMLIVRVDLLTGRYEAASEALNQAQKLLGALVAGDRENITWKDLSLNARLAEAVLDRVRGELPEARRIMDEALPQLEADSSSEPTDRAFATLLLQAWTMKTQFQFIAGSPEAPASANHAFEMAEKLAHSDTASDGEIGECARAYIVAGEIAARSGDSGAARRHWLAAADLLTPRMRGYRNWHLLDPAARAAARLGRSNEARAMIEKLNQLGYVPVEPWPDSDSLERAKHSDPQPR
jgi:serine/threonine protein kinase/tetratricopeptide (TPR) repeat protein